MKSLVVAHLPAYLFLLVIASIAAATFASCVYPAASPNTQGPPSGYLSPNIPSKYVGLRSPFSLEDEQALAAGRRLYLLNCGFCHGEDGRGRGAIAYQLEPMPADFAAPPMLRAFREHQDYVFWWVSEGVPQTAMPAYELRLNEVERWQVILYAWYLGEQAK